MAHEPVSRQRRGRGKGTWFLKEVTCSRHESHLRGSLHASPRRLVEWNDRGIVCPDDQQCRGLYMFERVSRQIRATAAADNGLNAVRTSGRGL